MLRQVEIAAVRDALQFAITRRGEREAVFDIRRTKPSFA
jgi:hypothetical protein